MIYRKVLFSLLILSHSAFAASNYGSVELTHLEPTKAESTWLRKKQFMPRYPMELAMKGIVGCGIFKVEVDEKGKTQNITLLNSLPKRVISRPAIKVMKKWDWVLAEGKTAKSEEKLLRLDFCISGNSQQESEERCKQQAAMTCE